MNLKVPDRAISGLFNLLKMRGYKKSMQALTCAVQGTMHTASYDCSVPGYNFSRMLGFDCSNRHVLLSR